MLKTQYTLLLVDSTSNIKIEEAMACRINRLLIMYDPLSILCWISSFLAIPLSRQTSVGCSNPGSVRLDLTHLLDAVAPIVPVSMTRMPFAIQMLDCDNNKSNFTSERSYLSG